MAQFMMRLCRDITFPALLWAAAVLCVCANPNSSLSCKSPEGRPLDWFILYKFPSLLSPVKTVHEGSSFAWIYPEAKAWQRNAGLSILNEKDSPLGVTLSPIFRNDSSTVAIFYNDEVPFLTFPSEKGHTKGVLYMNKNTGFWLIHSAPKFPNSPSSYVYPSTALRYGQTFLCISLNTSKSINDLSVQLLYDDIHIYFSPSSPPSWTSTYPHFLDLIRGRRKSNVHPPFTRTFVLSSLLNHRPFISFAKGPRFHDDLYAHLVAPALHTSLRVETWAHGSGGILNSTCSGVPFPIFNVDTITLNNITFSRMKDHSKWAIGGGYVCVGDINRMESQRKRGGGTLCFRDANAYKLFSSLIVETEPCTI